MTMVSPAPTGAESNLGGLPPAALPTGESAPASVSPEGALDATQVAPIAEAMVANTAGTTLPETVPQPKITYPGDRVGPPDIEYQRYQGDDDAERAAAIAAGEDPNDKSLPGPRDTITQPIQRQAPPPNSSDTLDAVGF